MASEFSFNDVVSSWESGAPDIADPELYLPHILDATQNAGAFSGAAQLPTSESAGGITDVLAGVVNPIMEVAKSVVGIQVMRDTLANQSAERALDRYAKQTNIDAARAMIGQNAQLANIRAATELAKAQQGLVWSRGGPMRDQLMLWLTVAGVVLAYFSYRKK